MNIGSTQFQDQLSSWLLSMGDDPTGFSFLFSIEYLKDSRSINQNFFRLFFLVCLLHKSLGETR